MLFIYTFIKEINCLINIHQDPSVGDKNQPTFHQVAVQRKVCSNFVYILSIIQSSVYDNLTKLLYNRFNQGLTLLAPVVQKVDGAIHRINLYPLDSAIGFPNTYPLDSDLSSGQYYPSFQQPGSGSLHRPHFYLKSSLF